MSNTKVVFYQEADGAVPVLKRNAAVLEALRAIAPVDAVRGINDQGSRASELPTEDMVKVGNHILYVIHNRAELSLEPAAAGFAAVLSGHSHRPQVEQRNGVLFVNPGSAGPRRFSLPVTIGLLVLRPKSCNARIIEIAVQRSRPPKTTPRAPSSRRRAETTRRSSPATVMAPVVAGRIWPRLFLTEAPFLWAMDTPPRPSAAGSATGQARALNLRKRWNRRPRQGIM